MVRALSIILALATLSQTPARDLERPRTGTASIAGVVTRADGPKGPLRRARVTVSGGALTAPRIDTTDDRGRFDIGGLPAGEYSVSASKPAYLTMNFGATRPRRQGTSIAVRDGQRVASIAVALPRGAAIAGTVTNAAGEPMSNVYVSLLHRAMYNGDRRLLPAPTSGFTNDRGEYRAYGLDAGEYLVVAQEFSDLGLPAEAMPLAPADIDRALQAARLGTSPATANSAVTTSTRAPRLGFAPVFHPGTANGALAATVTVGQGEERSAIDIRLDLVPMARIDGAVTSPDGAAIAPGMQVVLTSLGPPAPWEEYGGGGRLAPKTPDAQGRFAFVGVPPGEYSLMAMARPRPQFPGRGSVAPPAPPMTGSRIAYATVAVNGDDQNMTLTLQPGIVIAGRFVFDGTASPASMPGARLMLEDLRVDQSGGVRTYAADASADGAYQIADIVPGSFKISNETGRGLMPAANWALKSVMSGSRDLLDAPFELRPGESLPDVVVTLTDHPTELTGTLQGATGTPTSDYFIVAFSTDRQFWFPNSRRIMSVRPNTSGAYTIRNLPPGEYFISALTDVEDGEWFDPDFLKALLAASPLKLTIGEGQQKRQDLRIGR